MTVGGDTRPKIRAEDYGLPMACPKSDCGFRWLKLPGLKMRPCPNCGSALVSTRPKKRKNGQAIVEFAIIVPLLLFIILGGIEAGFLLVTKAHQDRETSVVAEWAALHSNESWHAVANKELPGCEVEVSSPLPALVQATSRCLYRAKTGLPMFNGIPLTSREVASQPSPDESAAPTPVASPS